MRRFDWWRHEAGSDALLSIRAKIMLWIDRARDRAREARWQ